MTGLEQLEHIFVKLEESILLSDAAEFVGRFDQQGQRHRYTSK